MSARADSRTTAAAGDSHNTGRPASKASSRSLKRHPSKLDLNPFVIADRLTAAKAGERAIDTQDAEPTTYSRLSLCVPNRGDDLGLDLAHPAPLKPEHGLVREEGARRSHQRVLKGTPPTSRQSTTEDRILRRRSTFDQLGGLRSPGITATASADVAKRSRQDEDLAMAEAYQYAGEIRSTRQSSDFSPADLGQKRAYHHGIQRGGDRDTLGTPGSDQTVPIRRPSSKQSSPGLRTLGGSGHGRTSMQPESSRSTTSYAGDNQFMSQICTLSPLIASGQEHHARQLSIPQDRIAKLSTRSSPYLARPHWKGEARHDHLPAHDIARTDPRPVRQAAARPHEPLSPAMTPRTDYLAGLKHHTPAAGAGQLQKMPSSPAVLRRAPGMANDHSRHRSPSHTGECGYCELEGGGLPPLARAAPLAQIAAIPERGRSSGNNNNNYNESPSPRESYHTAASYASSTSRPLRRIRETKADLRGSAPPAIARMGTPRTPSGYTAGGTSPSPPPPPPPVPAARRPDDHDCE